MPEFGTVAEVIELAIHAEHEAEAFYRVLAERFRSTPSVQTFWTQYAAEEVGHTRWLENLRARTKPEEVNIPVKPDVLEDARRAGSQKLVEKGQAIGNLQEAFELSNEIEHSEMNTIFEFLIAHFAGDDRTIQFLRDQLNTHVNRLVNDFPQPYDQATMRKGLTAE